MIGWLRSWILSYLPWGMDVIVWTQSRSTPFLDRLFSFSSFLGDEEFLLLLLTLIYWGYSKKVGRLLAYSVLVSTYVNSWVKHTFMIPRPDDQRVRIMRPVEPPNPAFPSGHAQTGVALWGILASRAVGILPWALAVAVILAVGFSRIYLGVHTPLDVIMGWILGAVYLVLFLWLMPRAERWLGRQRLPVKMGLAAMLPLAGIVLHGADLRGLYPAPDAATIGGTLLGMSLGFLLEPRWIGFREEGPWWQRLLRVALGFMIVGFFWQAPTLLLPEDMAHGLATAVRIVRSAVSGLAAILLAPWLFVRLRLAKASVRPIDRKGARPRKWGRGGRVSSGP